MSKQDAPTITDERTTVILSGGDLELKRAAQLWQQGRGLRKARMAQGLDTKALQPGMEVVLLLPRVAKDADISFDARGHKVKAARKLEMVAIGPFAVEQWWSESVDMDHDGLRLSGRRRPYWPKDSVEGFIPTLARAAMDASREQGTLPMTIRISNNKDGVPCLLSLGY